MNDRKVRAEQFIAQSGWANSTRRLLAGDASNRRYDRLSKDSGETIVLMDAPPDRGENVRPFIRVGEFLRQAGLSAPKIYHQDVNAGFLLIEDLGDAIFAKVVKEDPSLEETLYQAATDVLAQLHQQPVLSLPVCDVEWLTEMMAPAFEWYASTPSVETITEFHDVFRDLAEQLYGSKKVVILRDYHAENLIWLPDRTSTAKVGLLDFQDALLGHPAYDLVSILQDARRDVSEELEEKTIAHYLKLTGTNPVQFQSAYALLGAQRNLRILGIFARLCLRDGKAHYIDLIPRVWNYVMRNLKHPSLAPLAALVANILPHPTPEYLELLKSRCGTIPLQ